MFIRRPFGVERTRKALDIADTIERVLALSQEVLAGVPTFEPQGD